MQDKLSANRLLPRWTVQLTYLGPGYSRPLPRLSEWIDWDSIVTESSTSTATTNFSWAQRKTKRTMDELTALKKQIAAFEAKLKKDPQKPKSHASAQGKPSGGKKPPRSSEFKKDATAPKPPTGPPTSYANVTSVPGFKWEPSKDRAYQDLIGRLSRREAAVRFIQGKELTLEKIEKIVAGSVAKGNNANIPSNPQSLDRFTKAWEAFRATVGVDLTIDEYALVKHVGNAETKRYLEDLGIPQDVVLGGDLISNKQDAEIHFRNRFAEQTLRKMRSQANKEQTEMKAKQKAEQAKLEASWNPRFRNFYQEYPALKPMEESWETFLGGEEDDEEAGAMAIAGASSAADLSVAEEEKPEAEDW